jgi:hypothetical protein
MMVNPVPQRPVVVARLRAGRRCRRGDKESEIARRAQVMKDVTEVKGMGSFSI